MTFQSKTDPIHVSYGELTDLNEHLDKLEHSPKKDGKYICPSCGGNDLAISKKDGTKFKCYSGGQCSAEEVLRAMGLWRELGQSRSNEQPAFDGSSKPKQKKRRLSESEKYRQVQLKATKIESKWIPFY